MPEKSAITFLIFAWVIISCPFRMPPRGIPMITSTIAISTNVKPCCVLFIVSLPWTVQAIAYTQHPCHAENGPKRRPERQLDEGTTSNFRQQRRSVDTFYFFLPRAM